MLALRTTAIALAVLSLLSVSRPASAQARVEEKANFGLTGEILAVDAMKRQITVKGEHDKGAVYTVDRSATILLGAQKLELNELQRRWHVAMNGHTANGQTLVTYIKVVKTPH
jgi:hypothetical protein